MNIIWLFNCPYKPNAGGTERMTQLIARGLSRDGHNCIGQLVITEDGVKNFNYILDYSKLEICDISKFLIEQKVDVVINQLGNEKWLLEYFLDNGGRQWHHNGGLIISCHHFNPCWPSAIYYAKTKLHFKLKDYIGLIKSYLFSIHYKKLQKKLDYSKYRFVYDNSDYYVTLTEAYRKYIIKAAHIENSSKLVSIGNPLSFEEISSLNVLKKKEKLVIICARMDEVQKRISLALKTWKLLQKKYPIGEWKLKIIGDGKDLEDYKRITLIEGIKNVSFEGQCQPEPYYERASIFLMTSGYEGWGLTLTESLQRGVVPIVMDTSPVFRDIIKHKYNGFLSKRNSVKNLVYFLHILMNDCDLLNTMQRNALISANEFSLDLRMQEWRKIIPPMK